jgi:hypothetical protein
MSRFGGIPLRRMSLHRSERKSVMQVIGAVLRKQGRAHVKDNRSIDKSFVIVRSPMANGHLVAPNTVGRLVTSLTTPHGQN